MELKAAVVGSGPSGCYLAQALRKAMPDCEITLLDRLPVPYGLVRYGVAPDHQGTKIVTKQFARLFERDGVKFMGNVQVGQDVTLDALHGMFDVVVLASGLERDLSLGPAFEGVPSVYGAGQITRLWNGHPDAHGFQPDLGAHVLVVGNGNVAMDIVRLLAKTAADFYGSDIRGSELAHGVRQITMVGRSGPSQAKFDPAMVRELGKIDALNVRLTTPLPLDDDNTLLAALKDVSSKNGTGSKSLALHFHCTAVRPVYEERKLTGVVFTRDGEEHTLPCDSVITAIGFDATDSAFERAALLSKAVDLDAGHLATGLYATGWFWRGPNGTIAQNRVDAKTVAARIAQDLAATAPQNRPGHAALRQKILHRTTSYADWQKIDAAEQAGAGPNRVRAKFTTVQDMLAQCP